jgi:hypothetical protein
MRDLIRSPLQFVRRMTDKEWEAMMARAAAREVRRKRRQQARQQAPAVVTPSSRRLNVIRAIQSVDSSGVF